MVIDNRLLDAKSEAQLIENFNRILTMMDTLANVVADIEDSQLFKVIFNSDGGSSVPTQYVVEGEKAEEPNDPTKTGYDFDVWKKGNTEFDFDTPITSHTDLKATWTPVEYTITYNLDGGNLAEGVTNPTTYDIETATFILNNPTKEGYTFQGWTGANGDTPQTEVSVTVGSYGNKTFTANWQEAVQSTHTVTFALEGAEPPPAQTVADGESAIRPPDPTREGYNFGWWQDSQGEMYEFATPVYSDITLNGVWDAIE